MQKSVCSLGMLVLTAVFAINALGTTTMDETVYADIVTVKRGDVHQVAAIRGYVAYMDEEVIYATGNGVVERILAEPGQRLAAEEVIVRLQNAQLDDEAARLLSKIPMGYVPEDAAQMKQDLYAGMTIRAGEPCTLREMYLKEGSIVTAGMPIARTTSHLQEIRCQVSAADSAKISQGMWARLYGETGEAEGTAYVESVGEPEVDPLTGLTACTVILRPESHIELPEYAAVNVDVELGGSDDVRSLPVEAITERNTVWWVADGRCTEIPAEIVMCDEMLAWVRLPEGMQVAVGEFVEGQRVAATREEAE